MCVLCVCVCVLCVCVRDSQGGGKVRRVAAQTRTATYSHGVLAKLLDLLISIGVVDLLHSTPQENTNEIKSLVFYKNL